MSEALLKFCELIFAAILTITRSSLTASDEPVQGGDESRFRSRNPVQLVQVQGLSSG